MECLLVKQILVFWVVLLWITYPFNYRKRRKGNNKTLTKKLFAYFFCKLFFLLFFFFSNLYYNFIIFLYLIFSEIYIYNAHEKNALLFSLYFDVIFSLYFG